MSNVAEARAQLRSLIREDAPGVFSFAMFSEDFSAMWVQEVAHYSRSGLPIRRPNSMNNYGLIVNDIGLQPFIDVLQRHYLQPVATLLFPHDGGLAEIRAVV